MLKRICMYQCTLGYNASLTYLLCIYLKREGDHYVEQVRVNLLKQVEQVLVVRVEFGREPPEDVTRDHQVGDHAQETENCQFAEDMLQNACCMGGRG